MILRSAAGMAFAFLTLVSCSSQGADEPTLPTPGPSAMIIQSDDATFRVLGRVSPEGVRGSSGETPVLDGDGLREPMGATVHRGGGDPFLCGLPAIGSAKIHPPVLRSPLKW